MDDSTAKTARLPRARIWLARHFVAMIALAIVVATLSYKNLNYQQLTVRIDLGTGESQHKYGWPIQCLDRIERFSLNPYGSGPSHTINAHWQTQRVSLAIDLAVVIMALVGTWILFMLTQRKVGPRMQISLSSLMAFIALAGIICAIWNAKPIGGW